MKNIRKYLIILFFLNNVLSVQSILFAQEQNVDPVEVIWETFLDSNDGTITVDEWIDRIIDVIDKNPSSLAKNNVLHNLVGTCNSAGKYDKSIELLLKVLPSETSTYERLRTIGALGAVYKEIYLEAINQRDIINAEKQADNVLKYYNQFTNEFNSLDVKNLSSEELFDLQQRLIFFLKTEADLLYEIKKNTNASLDKYNEAISVLSSNPELTQRGMLLGTGFDESLFFKDKALTLLTNGNTQEAADCMIEFGKSHSATPKIKSFEARQFADIAYPQKGKEYRNFLKHWLDNVLQDSETVIIFRDIGNSFFEEKNYDEAIKMFEIIRESWWQQLLDLDKIALEQQMGGYCADVLRMLAECYQKTNQLQKAMLCIEELKKIVPKDTWIYSLEVKQSQAELDQERLKIINLQNIQKNPHHIIIIIGINVILIVLIIFSVLYKKNKKF
jgi:tetratricopeptide (TPR) repeat protein